LEKTNVIEDSDTFNKLSPFTSDKYGEKSSVIEKIDENKNDEKKRGFFSSFFGKRKSKENNDKVSSISDQKDKENYQGMTNSDKNHKDDIIITKGDIAEKNKNKEKNEVKYLSDEDLDELLKE
jgi:hypothetical protein